MSEPPDAGEKARTFPIAVEAQLRAVNVHWLERKFGVSTSDLSIKCCRNAYDIFAQHRLESELPLVDSVLEQDIPDDVFDVAVEKGWIRHQAEQQAAPQRRRVVGRLVLHRDEPWIPDRDWFPTERTPTPAPRPPPEPVMLGSHKVPREFRNRFLGGVLAGRIEYWKSRRDVVPRLAGDGQHAPLVAESKSATPTVSDQLNVLREESRRTEEQIAEALGIDPSSVSRHMSGKQIPYDRNILAYERVFSKLLNRKIVISKTPRRRK